MFGITFRSDKFCAHYDNLVKQGFNNQSSGKRSELFNLINGNLEAIGSSNSNLNSLEFNADGKINLSDGKAGKTSAKVHDLRVFTKFVNSWCKANPLNEEETQILQSSLAAAKAKLIVLEKEGNLRKSIRALSKASENAYVNETLSTGEVTDADDVGTKGKKIMNESILKLQKEAAEHKKSLHDLKRNRRNVVAIAGVGLVACFVGIPFLVFVFPLGIALISIGLLIGGIGTWRLDPIEQEMKKKQNQYDKCIRDIKTAESAKKRLSEPAFIEFLKKYPATDDQFFAPENLKDFHRLYKDEESLKGFEEQLKTLEDPSKHLQKIVYELKIEIIDLKNKLKVSKESAKVS